MQRLDSHLVGDENKEEQLRPSARVARPVFAGSAQQRIALSDQLIDACLNQHAEVALELINKGADPDHISRTKLVFIDHPSSYDFSCYYPTPILVAMAYGLDKVVNRLIEVSANVNSSHQRRRYIRGIQPTSYEANDKPETLLHIAARMQHNAANIKALIAAGANVDAEATYTNPKRSPYFFGMGSDRHKRHVQLRAGVSCFFGCIVFSPCAATYLGFWSIPKAKPEEIARYLKIAENVAAFEAAKAPALAAPMQMVMK